MDDEKRKRLEAARWRVGDAKEYVEGHSDDPLAAAKGIALGLAIGAAMWCSIIGGLIYWRYSMSVELGILLIFSPLLFFVACGLVVAAEQWWESRGRLKR